MRSTTSACATAGRLGGRHGLFALVSLTAVVAVALLTEQAEQIGTTPEALLDGMALQFTEDAQA
ncbi:hypothetical protein [Kitasatospora sp. NPDC088548]|uniref:hypothetical protein n=1 Tax=Kitasatospora sp. NPDC088548 TaxID=3364075 RepID=UPI0037FAC46D